MDGTKRAHLRVRLRVTARRRGADGADRAGSSGGTGPDQKRRMDAPLVNSAAKLQRREIGGRQLAARGGGAAAAVPERFRNMQLQVSPPTGGLPISSVVWFRWNSLDSCSS
jgi:hypothetical protein